MRLSCQTVFSGVYGLEASDEPELSLGNGFSLVKTNDWLLSARDKSSMTGSEWHEAANVKQYLVYKHQTRPWVTLPFAEIKNIFANGLMALQVLKPIKTLGIVFSGEYYDQTADRQAAFLLQQIERRSPMEPGPWALKKVFDRHRINRVPATIESIQKVMNGASAEKRNAIILLQLGLEHHHPLVAGLLWVTGLEAIFDSWGKEEFKKKLCDALGQDAPVFPN